MLHSFLLRLWLPDRPGALGQVASRIGGLRGDVVGIEILERGGGRAVDELVVALPDPGVVELLIHEISEVEGVAVEWVQSLGGADHDPQLALLEAAARLVADRGRGAAALDGLCDDLRRAFEASWAAVVDRGETSTVAAAGDPPAVGWMVAFVEGSRHLDGEVDHGAEDVAWADLPGQARSVVVGRTGRPFRARERRQLGVLARISAAVTAA